MLFFKDILHLFCHHFGDPAAPGRTITAYIFSYTCFAGKITFGDSLALGASKFFAEPFRKAMRGIEGAIEFVHIIRKCIPATDHER